MRRPPPSELPLCPRDRALSRRDLLRLAPASALSLAVSAAGCVGSGGRRAGATVIRFWNGWTGPDGGRALQIVRRFNRENPDVEVRMQRIDWNTYYNKLFVAGIAGRAPELFIIHTPSLRRYVDAGFLQPLDDLVAEHRFPVDDLDPNVWAGAKLNGRHYGLPVDVHPLGAFYNRGLLRDATGSDTLPEDRDGFLAALRAMSRGEGDARTWGFGFSNPSSTVFSLMCQFGGRFFTPDEKQCVLNGPENAAALALCQDLIRRERVAPPPEGDDPWIAFRQGRIGVTWNGIYMLPDLKKQADLSFNGAPVAQLGARKAVWASSHNFCIRAGLDARTREAAWRFAEFYSNNSLDWADAGQVPVRRSLRNSPRFAQMAVQSQFARQIPYAVYPPQIPFVFEFQTEFDYMTERVLRNTATPEVALREAEDRVNQIIARRAAEGAGRMSGKARAYRYSGWLFVVPYLVLFATFLLGPLGYGLYLSFHRWDLLSTAPPRFIGAGNYREAFADPYFWKALWVTVKMVVFTVPATVGLALLLAAAIDAVPARRQGFYRAAFFVPGMLTVTVVGILWRWFYNPEFGVFDAGLAHFGVKIPWLSEPRWAMASIILMTVWWTVGGPMVTLLAGLQGQPPQYIEAASLDGANGWQRFWRVRVPLLRPVLLFVATMHVIGAFQIFGQTFLVTQGGPEFATRTMVHYIYNTAFGTYRMGYAAALSWLLFLVIAGVAVVQFRLLREQGERG